MSMRIAVFPGTFDPITNGHENLIIRAAKLFDKVIVAVAINAQKKPLLDLKTRVNLIKEIVNEQQNVDVCGFDTLLIDFVKQKQASVILRGLRVVSDFEYEFQLATMNYKLNSEIETVFLTPNPKCAFISSSLVKEIAQLKGDVTSFVPKIVMEALVSRF